MSMDKGINYGKEKRNKYRGAKEIDRSCRNNGSCEHCKSNRLYRKKKRELAAQESLEEFEEEQ